jgi:predicted transcriptional regulator
MKPEPSIFDEVDEAFESRRETEALADMRADRVVPHEEVAARLETWGDPDEKPAPDKWFR